MTPSPDIMHSKSRCKENDVEQRNITWSISPMKDAVEASSESYGSTLHLTKKLYLSSSRSSIGMCTNESGGHTS